jgi:hypothetical protein
MQAWAAHALNAGTALSRSGTYCCQMHVTLPTVAMLQVVRLQGSLLQLQELHLCGNGISRLDCPELLAAVQQQEQQGGDKQAVGSSVFSSLQVCCCTAWAFRARVPGRLGIRCMHAPAVGLYELCMDACPCVLQALQVQ